MAVAVVKEKKYQGVSSGPTATLEAALEHALASAAQGEKTNHFFWKMGEVSGDFGGFVGKNITVQISIHN